ncbi:MAG: DUF998 domain-containing protein [Candidatus Bathyarchaeota archaeon]|nr:DUF998 domain-containing protein [Candidatus Bathyarchaeota archaeon]
MQTNRVGAIAGVLSPITAIIFISLAIASYPAFSWTNNALSDLGVVEGITSTLFTVGICGAGVFGILFAVLGLYGFAKKSLLGKIGSGFFAAATIALVLIGVFNESFRPTHYLVSVAFFVLAPIAGLIWTGAFWRGGKRRLAVFTVGIALFAAAVWILEFTIHYVPEVAIPEAVSAAAISAWVIVLSAKILKKTV